MIPDPLLITTRSDMVTEWRTLSPALSGAGGEEALSRTPLPRAERKGERAEARTKTAFRPLFTPSAVATAMADYLPKKRSEMLMAWLKQATPDEWHQVASDWNWGSGEDALRWIVEQPDCDKATALLIFWRGEPNYFWGEAADREGLDAAGALGTGDVYDMLVGIVSRWRAGGYTRAELGYDPEADARARASDIACSASHPALAITEDMIRPVIGRLLARGDFNEGLPYHVEAATG